MTIKTELLLLERESNLSRRSDNTTSSPVAMHKRGAVRNLFGAPDRSELRHQLAQQDDENSKKLDGFRYGGLIGVLMNPPDHAKRLKRQSSVQSESEDDEQPTSFQRINLLHGGTAEASSSVVLAPPSASSSSASSSSTSSTDAHQELASNKNGSPRIIVPRPRGQQTITSYFHVIKRGRTDRRDQRWK